MATKKSAKAAKGKKTVAKPVKRAAAGKAKPAKKKALAKPKTVKKAAPKKKAKARASKPFSPPQQTLDLPAFTSNDPREAYDHFLPMVQAFPASQVAVTHANGSIVRTNVSRGFAAVAPQLSEGAQLVPSVSIERLMELPSLALAFEYAARQIPSGASTGDIESALEQVSEPRELTLGYLEIAASLGLVDAKRVADIRAGHGRLDKAQDCVDIGGVFADYATALAGKHPFTAAYINEMASTGSWLVRHLTPTGAIRNPSLRPPQADIRDRFFHALEIRYEDLEKVAVALFGLRGTTEQVPSLMSHAHHVATAAPVVSPVVSPTAAVATTP